MVVIADTSTSGGTSDGDTGEQGSESSDSEASANGLLDGNFQTFEEV
jgi:hypothetical protein